MEPYQCDDPVEGGANHGVIQGLDKGGLLLGGASRVEGGVLEAEDLAGLFDALDELVLLEEAGEQVELIFLDVLLQDLVVGSRELLVLALEVEQVSALVQVEALPLAHLLDDGESELLRDDLLLLAPVLDEAAVLEVVHFFLLLAVLQVQLVPDSLGHLELLLEAPSVLLVLLGLLGVLLVLVLLILEELLNGLEAALGSHQLGHFQGRVLHYDHLHV